MTVTTFIAYPGNGVSTLFTIPFSYIDPTHVKVGIWDQNAQTYIEKAQTDPTYGWSFANEQVVQFNSPPPISPDSEQLDNIAIYRETYDDSPYAVFSPGAPIKSSDLNDNFEQSIYIVQEATFSTSVSADNSQKALEQAGKALDAANEAAEDAAAAETAASQAQAAASQASASAATATSDAAAAQAAATQAGIDAAQAASDAAQAGTDAATAITDAGTATTTANTALSTAQTAESTANTALNTANQASTDATQASADAAAAAASLGAAEQAAQDAQASADAALIAVNDAQLYEPLLTVADIPANPSDGDRYEVKDATGIDSFTPLAGLPTDPGIVWDAGLYVRINYTTSGATWNFAGYGPNNPDARYSPNAMPKSGGTFTGDVYTDPGVEVGIGTTNPMSTLEVYRGTISVTDPNSITTGDTGLYGALWSEGSTLNQAGYQIAFNTGSNNARTERMRINANGYVGIGTTNPAALLSVSSPNQGTAETVAEFGNQTLAGALQIETNGDLDWGFNARNARNLTFSTNQTERARITGGGYVGIGTTNPATLLHLAANAPYITFEDVDNNQDWELQATAWFALRNKTADSELLRVTPSGSVGIGTTNPAAPLSIASAANSEVVRFGSAGGVSIIGGGYTTVTSNAKSVGAPLDFENILGDAGVGLGIISPMRAPNSTEVGGVWVATGNATAGTTYSWSSMTPALTWNTSGNVGIKTDSPTTSLDIDATDAVKVPVGTTAERPSGAAGMFRFNDTTDKFEGHNGTEWGAIGGDIGEAPVDGNQYARQNASWTPVQGGDNNVTYNGASAWGYVAADGTLENGLNIASVTRVAAGTYDIVFTTPMPSAEYAVMTAVENDDGKPTVFDRPATGFRLFTKQVSTGTLADMKFSFTVHSQNALPPAGTAGTDAWGTVQGNGALDAGYNIASVTRAAIGTYAVAFTTPMPSSDYAVNVTSNSVTELMSVKAVSKTVNGFTVTAQSTSTGGQVDGDYSFTVNATNANLPYTFTKEQIQAAANNTGSYAWCSAASDGSVNAANNLQPLKTAIGKYRFTFNTPLDNTGYVVSATSVGAADTQIRIHDKQPGYFDVWVFDALGSTLIDIGLDVTVTASKAQPLSLGGGADAWGNVDSDGSLIQGHNIASVTRSAAGTYDVVFATPMPSATYAAVASGDSGIVIASPQSKTATGFQVTTASRTDGAPLNDLPFSFAIFATDGNAGGFWARNATDGEVSPTNTNDKVKMGPIEATSLNGSAFGFRNILINGNLTINQRGVAIADAAIGTYGPDRWKKTGASLMTQSIEEGNFLPGATYTLSGVNVTTQQLTAPSSGNWTLPDILTTASQIQLERGEVATPFEFRPKGLELSLCQRYCFVSGDVTTAIIINDSEGLSTLNFPVQMRATPTAYRGDGASVNTTNIIQGNSSANYGTLGSVTANNLGVHYFNYTKSGGVGSLNAVRIESLRFDAEL